MLIRALLYNILVSGLVVIEWRRLAADPRPLRAFGSVFFCGTAAAVLAAVLGLGSLFATARLLAYGVFLQGFIVLAGMGLLMRRRAPAAAVVSGLLAIGLAATAVFAFLIEPFRLEVTRFQVSSPKIMRPVRVLVLADLQTDVIGDFEREVFRRAMAEKPDLILFAGDYLQASEEKELILRAELKTLLREEGLRAPLGVFAVRGNVDNPDWAGMFQGLPVTCFDSVRSVEAGPLVVTGMGMEDSFNPSLTIGRTERFQIAVGHSPDFALGHIQADLLVAGHTHGGQVRIPGLGPLITLSRVPRSWAVGMTSLEGDRTLVVSRGAGMERGRAPRLRFLCRPELVVIDLVPRPR